MGRETAISSIFEKGKMLVDIFREERADLKSDVVETHLADAEAEAKMQEPTPLSEATAPLLAGTKFEEKFETLYKGAGKDELEKMNNRISSVLREHIEAALPDYPEATKVQISMGMSFALMDAMGKAGATESKDLFSFFSGKSTDASTDGAKKGVLSTLFTGLSKSTHFTQLGRKYLNMINFFQDYKTDLTKTDIKAGYITEMLTTDTPNFSTKYRKDKDGRPIPFADTKFPDMTADKSSVLTDIANDSKVTDAMTKELLTSLAGTGAGGALRFAKGLLSSREKRKSFIAGGVGRLAGLFDSNIGKLLFGGKSITESLDAKTGTTMDVVLTLIGFEGGRKGVQNEINAKKTSSSSSSSGSSGSSSPSSSSSSSSGSGASAEVSTASFELPFSIRERFRLVREKTKEITKNGALTPPYKYVKPDTDPNAIMFVESKFDTNAVSPTGAEGIGQFTGVAIDELKKKRGYDTRLITRVFGANPIAKTNDMGMGIALTYSLLDRLETSIDAGKGPDTSVIAKLPSYKSSTLDYIKKIGITADHSKLDNLISRLATDTNLQKRFRVMRNYNGDKNPIRGDETLETRNRYALVTLYIAENTKFS